MLLGWKSLAGLCFDAFKGVQHLIFDLSIFSQKEHVDSLINKLKQFFDYRFVIANTVELKADPAGSVFSVLKNIPLKDSFQRTVRDHVLSFIDPAV